MVFLFPHVIYNTRMLAPDLVSKYLLGSLCGYLRVFYPYYKQLCNFQVTEFPLKHSLFFVFISIMSCFTLKH